MTEPATFDIEYNGATRTFRCIESAVTPDAVELTMWASEQTDPIVLVRSQEAGHPEVLWHGIAPDVSRLTGEARTTPAGALDSFEERVREDMLTNMATAFGGAMILTFLDDPQAARPRPWRMLAELQECMMHIFDDFHPSFDQATFKRMLQQPGALEKALQGETPDPGED